MIGHHALIVMRRAGEKPRIVSVETDPSLRSRCVNWPEEFDGQPRLLVEPADVLARLDFRPCIGCMCLVTGPDQARVIAVCEALIAAGAAPVTGMHETRAAWGWERAVVFTTPQPAKEAS